MNASKNEHPLHNIIGQILSQIHSQIPLENNTKLFSDQACGLKDPINIQLTLDKKVSRRFRLCFVDALFLVKDKIRIVIEIEESECYPEKIVGKFFTFMLTQYFIPKMDELKDHPAYCKNKDLIFLQIINTTHTDSNKNSAKKEQLIAIEKTIQEYIASHSHQSENRYKYRIFLGRLNDFKKGNLNNELREIINKALI